MNTIPSFKISFSEYSNATKEGAHSRLRIEPSAFLNLSDVLECGLTGCSARSF